MNIADGLINLVIYLYQNILLKWLPVDLPGISFHNFSQGIDSLKTYIITPIYFLDKFLPIGEFFILLSAFIGLELVLWIIRLAVAGFNMVRGSGAKV